MTTLGEESLPALLRYWATFIIAILTQGSFADATSMYSHGLTFISLNLIKNADILALHCVLEDREE